MHVVALPCDRRGNYALVWINYKPLFEPECKALEAAILFLTGRKSRRVSSLGSRVTMKAALAAATNAILPLKRLIAAVPALFGGCVMATTAILSRAANSASGSSTPRTEVFTWV